MVTQPVWAVSFVNTRIHLTRCTHKRYRYNAMRTRSNGCVFFFLRIILPRPNGVSAATPYTHTAHARTRFRAISTGYINALLRGEVCICIFCTRIMRVTVFGSRSRTNIIQYNNIFYYIRIYMYVQSSGDGRRRDTAVDL